MTVRVMVMTWMDGGCGALKLEGDTHGNKWRDGAAQEMLMKRKRGWGKQGEIWGVKERRGKAWEEDGRVPPASRRSCYLLPRAMSGSGNNQVCKLRKNAMININEKHALSSKRKKCFINWHLPKNNQSVNPLNHKIKHTQVIIKDSS